MVSFSCENCGDVLTKKKLDPHRNQCRGATYTCLDCMTHFMGTEYRTHTSCISEAQKYQGKLYKEKPVKGKNNKRSKITAATTVPVVAVPADINGDAHNVAPVAFTTALISTADEKSTKSSKKRKRDQTDDGVSDRMETVSQETEAMSKMSKSKKEKKDKKNKKEKSSKKAQSDIKDTDEAIALMAEFPIESAMLGKMEDELNALDGVNGDEITQSKKRKDKAETGTTGIQPFGDKDPLVQSFLSIARKELLGKSQIDFSKAVKKWKKKNGEDETEKLLKLIKIRKGHDDGLVIE